jgi:Xaa-Pro aminopeptidase
LQALGAKKTAFNPDATLCAQHESILKEYTSGTLTSSSALVANLRMIKDEAELELMRAASELAEGVLIDILDDLRSGVREREVAALFEYEFRRRGASGSSFSPIVLFGPRSSLPHGNPGETQLREGAMVLLDVGCRLNGYCSDLTRTYAFGNIPESWFEEAYALVLTAQQLALESVRPGITARELDAVARGIIRDAGHGDHFGHGLGHGVGIEVHESPRVASESDVVLREGMVITIEPGVYIPGRGGIRIEDLVVVTNDGCEVLTRTSKELEVI